MLELQQFCFALFHLQCRDILGDVVAAQGDDCQVAQQALVIDRHRRCVSSQVHQHAATALLRLGEHVVGQHQRCGEDLGNGDARLVESLVEVAVEEFSLGDVEEVALQPCALDSHRIDDILVADLILLCDDVEDLQVGIVHAAVAVHQSIYDIAIDNRLRGQVLDNHVAHAPHRLAAYSDIHMADVLLHGLAELGHDILQAGSGLVDIVDHSLADTLRRILLDERLHGDAPVEILLAGNPPENGRPQFNGYNKFCHIYSLFKFRKFLSLLSLVHKSV